MPTQELIDEDDWVELDRNVAPKVLADVTVRVTVGLLGRNSRTPKARTAIAFRGDPGKWIEANGPRFKVLLGGQNANCMRIVPDLHRGKFEAGESRFGNTKMMRLGMLAAWPAEDRELTAASWQIGNGFMQLTLPADFAKPRGKAPPDGRPREFAMDEPKRAGAPALISTLPALPKRAPDAPVAPKPKGDQEALAAARDVLNRAVVPPVPTTSAVPPAARVVAAPAPAPSKIAQRVAAAPVKPSPPAVKPEPPAVKPERRVVKSFEDLDPYAHLRAAR